MGEICVVDNGIVGSLRLTQALCVAAAVRAHVPMWWELNKRQLDICLVEYASSVHLCRMFSSPLTALNRNTEQNEDSSAHDYRNPHGKNSNCL